MNREFAFWNGWEQVRSGDRKAVRVKLMEAMNISSRRQFLARLKGEHEPKVTEHAAIERVFGEYGITDVWGHVVGITDKLNLV